MPSKEIWKDIKGYEEYYQVSNLGRIFSKISDRVLKPQPTKKDYLRIKLSYGKNHSVHRLVLKNFEPHDEAETLQVNHKNMVKDDNRLVNLEWCTCKENVIHSFDNGRAPARGTQIHRTKLTEAHVLQIRAHLSEGVLTLKDIGALYGVGESAIAHIKQKRTWGWLK